jgi:hypothetical protein
MYHGISAHYSVPPVSSYTEARRALKAARDSVDGRLSKYDNGWPLGGHSKSVCRVREDRDEGWIAFRLYDTDVVSWYRDGSVEIDNYGSATTAHFARRFLPGGIWLSYPTVRHGVEGGHKGIYYRAGDDWSTTRVCFGGLVRFRRRGGYWRPDEHTLDRIRFPELDLRRTREVSAKYHLRDFENWLSMAPRHLELEHRKWDMWMCCDALEVRDFRTAAIHLPLVKEPRGFGVAGRMRPLPIRTTRYDEHVTMTSLRKLKLALWEIDGLVTDIEVTSLPRSEFDRRMARVREMNALGLSSDYGPRE